MLSSSELEKDVNAAVEKKNSQMEQWQVTLLDSFELEKTKIMNLQDLIKSPQLLSATTETETALSELSKIKSKY
jgi:hypothetical protein